MKKIEDPSPETQDEHSNISKGSRIIGVVSLFLGVISVVLSQTYYDGDMTFLVGGIFLIIIGSLSVLLS
jgi:hypothetical protein